MSSTLTREGLHLDVQDVAKVRRTALSASTAKSLAHNCAAGYAFGKISGERETDPFAATSQGTAAHAVLEELYKLPKGKRTRRRAANILLALVFISILGPGKYNVIFALAIVFIPSFARITRSEFLSQREMDYVKSARLMGASHLRIMFVHIFPNALPSVLSMAAIGFNNAVLAEAGMSYLGIGVQPPDASLGRMLSESQTYLLSAPWCSIFPGLAVILLALAFSLLSDGILKKGGR